MISLQKLTSQNMDDFKKVYAKSRVSENYDRDFFKLYKEQNFVVKFLFKRFLRLFVYNNNNIIGFMWYETPIDVNVRIWALYVDTKYMQLLTEGLLEQFNNNFLSYEAIDNNINSIILKKLGFKRVRPTVFMELETISYNNYNYKSDYNITFRNFKIGEDERLRCNIQNDIFTDFTRTPLTIDDVYSDLNQDYYINDFAIFIEVNNITIGYGQIIFNRDMYTVVNFGIVSKYRGCGYGKLLLNKLINLSKEKDIKNLYIRVDENNVKARNLYEAAGFKEKNIISKWDR